MFLPPAARGTLFCQRWQVKVKGAGEELENDIKKEANFSRSPMPWGPLDPLKKLLIRLFEMEIGDGYIE